MRHTRRAGAAATLAIAVPVAALIGMMANAESAARIGVKLTTKPAAVANTTSARFAMKATVRKGVKAQYCRIDASAWQKCKTGFVAENLAQGKHAFQAKLVMKNGRVGVTRYNWSVDSVAPEAPTVYGGDTQWSNAASRMVTHFAAPDPAPSAGLAGYERRVSNDGGQTWGATTAGDSMLVTREGDTRVQYRAVDVAGNVSEWAQAIVRLDRTDPTVPTTAGGTGGWTSATSVDVVDHQDAADGLSGIPADGYEMQIRKDGDPFWLTAQLDDATLTVKQEGTTQVRFRAVDRAGNTGAWSATETVMIDRTAPQVPVVPDAATWTNAASETVTATSADTLGAITAAGIDHYLVKTSNDATTYSQATAGDGVVTVTDEGYEYVSAAACDAAGNCSQFSKVTAPAVMIDRTPPGAPYLYPSSIAHTGDCVTWYESAYFTVYGSDGSAGIDHYLYRATSDLGTTIEGSDPASAYNLYFTLTRDMIAGKVDIQFAAVDRAGNVGAYTDITDPYAEVCLG